MNTEELMKRFEALKEGFGRDFFWGDPEADEFLEIEMQLIELGVLHPVTYNED